VPALQRPNGARPLRNASPSGRITCRRHLLRNVYREQHAQTITEALDAGHHQNYRSRPVLQPYLHRWRSESMHRSRRARPKGYVRYMLGERVV